MGGLIIMLNCEKCETLLARYLVGNLPFWSRGAVAKHLDACKPCLQRVEAHYRVALLMERLPAEDPPNGLWNRVQNEIGQEAPGHARVPTTSRDWRPGLVVAAAGLAAGVFFGQALNGSQPDQASTFATMEQASPQIATFVQHHSRMAADHPLADPVSLSAYQTAAFRDTERLEGETGASR